MSSEEFLERFQVLYNNIDSNAAPGLNEYDISVFLTKAQDEILKNYFNPLGNKYKEGFDGSPKRQIDFSRIIKTTECQIHSGAANKIDLRSSVYDLPSDVFFILDENLYTDQQDPIQAIPISFTEYSMLMRKPYKYPHKSEAWRLMSQVVDGEVQIEIISATPITKYLMRYVRKVTPIIVGDLSQWNLTIDGLSTVTECELDEELHEEILQRAVEIAKNAYTGDLASTVQLGQRSE